jgi:hypothetical protein
MNPQTKAILSAESEILVPGRASTKTVTI